MFYKNKHSGRHLNWLHGQCSALVNPNFTEKPYGFTTTVYQAAVMMLFNEHESLTFAQIGEYTNLSVKELTIQLKYLCNPKQRILNKTKLKDPKFTPDEAITVNPGFKNASLKLNFIPKKTHKKKTATEKSEVQTAVEQEIKIERQHVLDAIIVRIMKARKTEQHNPLIQECMKQVTLFKP